MIRLRLLLRLPMILMLVAETLFSQNPPQPVWGFADLHSHPATHLAFGADQNGQNGLLWGKPAHDGGLDLATSSDPTNLANDLPPCPSGSFGFTHNASTGDDFIKLTTDALIVSNLDKTSPGWTHQSQGWPSFGSPQAGWPAALTVDHQAMHIHSIHRAYLGGLRLMFASATESELISKFWNQGFNLGGNPMPTHDAEFDYNSAVTQLTYITNLVNANSDWMQIVTTPAQARAAINSNPPKLAVVLSLELDSLSFSDIQRLVQQFGVAHVIPVHLADNDSFGGTAIYSDEFNGLNNFLNGSYYSTVSNPNVNFNLGAFGSYISPVTLSTILNVPTGTVTAGEVAAIGVAALGPGAVATVGAAIALAAIGIQLLPTGALGYQPVFPPAGPLQAPGQINSRDLNQSQFYALMQMRLLLDVAHMGETSASTALRLAQKYHYPLMDSHTGIRCDSPNPTSGFPAVSCQTSFGSPPTPSTPGAAVNERSLPVSQLAIISQLGGVIGLGLVPSLRGTAPNQSPDPDPVTTWINNYSIALSLMGNRRVALGTDANGLSPLLQQDTIPTNYPFNVAAQFGCPAGCQQLDRYQLVNSTNQLGNRKFDFQEDGIATYGLLADFIQAASLARPVYVPAVYNPQCVQGCYSTYKTCWANWNPGDHPKGTPNPCEQPEADCVAACKTGGTSSLGPPPTTQIAALFHSAEDTIQMWEAVENALLINGTNISNAQVGQPFSWTLSASGGTAPYTWSIQSGSLPPGLSLSNSGTITGTGTTTGVYSFNAAVQDSSAPQPVISQWGFQINMIPRTGCPSDQHCCSTPAANGTCLSGCIPKTTMCQPLCRNGGRCCGGPLPTGQCDSVCVTGKATCP